MSELIPKVGSKMVFSTNRFYSATAPQVIECVVTEVDTDDFCTIITVAFRDKVRMLDGYLKVASINDDPITEAQILIAYDNGGYDYLLPSDIVLFD